MYAASRAVGESIREHDPGSDPFGLSSRFFNTLYGVMTLR